MEETASLDEILLHGSASSVNGGDDGEGAETSPRGSAASPPPHPQQHPSPAAATSDSPASPEQHQGEEKEEQHNNHPLEQQGEEGGAEGEGDPVCRICRVLDDRPLLRFHPSDWAPSVTPTCSQHIALHQFCGKTASILQDQPDLEILTKAGLKRKHGIGSEIQAALARTRSATADNNNVFYLVREFEAHLAAIKAPLMVPPPLPMVGSAATTAYGGYVITCTNDNTTADSPLAGPSDLHHSRHHQHGTDSPTAHNQHCDDSTTTTPPSVSSPSSVDPILQSLFPQSSATSIHHSNYLPSSAAAAAMESPPLPGRKHQNNHKRHRVECPCGGSHLGTHTPAGVRSFRAHVASQRHQQWLLRDHPHSPPEDDDDETASSSSTTAAV